MITLIEILSVFVVQVWVSTQFGYHQYQSMWKATTMGTQLQTITQSVTTGEQSKTSMIWLQRLMPETSGL